MSFNCEIALVPPTKVSKNSVIKFKKSFFDNSELIINGSSLLDQLEYEEWIEHITVKSKGFKDWVPFTTFFAIRQNDNKIIGIIDIRHNIENAFLKNYGGHIGYSVVPSQRKKGYGTKMLKLALKYCKTLNLSSVMLGCYSSNIASIKTILNCNGKLIEQKDYIDGEPMNIYTITT